MFRICLNINMKAVRTLETSGGMYRSILYNSQEESAFINLCISFLFFYRTYTNIENEKEATEDHDVDDHSSNTREKHTPSPSVSASTDSKRKRSDTSDLCETLTRFIASRDKSYREGTTKKKQLAIFFEDIAETMIKFPEVDQAEIKSEIFNLVNKKEIELLRQKQSVPHQNQQNILSPALYHSQYSPKAFFPTEPPTTSQSSHGYFSQAFSHVPTNLSLNHPNSLYPPAE